MTNWPLSLYISFCFSSLDAFKGTRKTSLYFTRLSTTSQDAIILDSFLSYIAFSDGSFFIFIFIYFYFFIYLFFFLHGIEQIMCFIECHIPFNNASVFEIVTLSLCDKSVKSSYAKFNFFFF